MITFINMYREYHAKICKWIEDRRTFIPLSGVLLWYLKIPIIVRVLIVGASLVITHYFFYNIGFVIAQSKAKNEVLSLVTAYHNPVGLPESLYYLYAFIYFFMFVLTVLPIIVVTFGGEWMVSSQIKPLIIKINSRNARLIIYTFISFVWIVASAAVSFLIKGLPLIPYYLLHASKQPAFLEMFVKWLFKNGEQPAVIEAYTFDAFQSEFFISLQLGNILMAIFIFLTYFYIKYHRRFVRKFKDMQQLMKFSLQFSLLSGNTYDFFAKNIMALYRNLKLSFLHILFGISVLVLFLATTFVFVTHTAYQIGSFGKSLTQFETDYVEVAYVFNDEILTFTGYRVFQDKGFIVLREKAGRLRYIETEQIEVRTMLADN